MESAVANVVLPGGLVELALLGILAAALLGIGFWLIVKCRETPAQRERRRVLGIQRIGRVGDANITDIRDGLLYYSYEVRGVAYTTSQDVSVCKDWLPADLCALIGPAGLKYSSRNPANSIVVGIGWSGVRIHNLQLQEIHAQENRPS